MWAMILAAGFGTRMRPISEEMPKPLMPVMGVPNIVRTIRHLTKFGVRRLVINLHHLPEAIPTVLGDGSALGVEISYSFEPCILGTGGGLRRALPLMGDETFLLVNGDALFAADIGRALTIHRERGALATLVVREDANAKSYGVVALGPDGRIVAMAGTGRAPEGSLLTMFTGVHVIEPDIARHLPEEGCIVRLAYAPLVERGAPIHGVVDDSYFCDLGTPGRYLAANVDLVTGRSRMAGIDPPESGRWIGADVDLGVEAFIGPGSVVCDGARLAAGTSVERSVVFPGASVSGRVTGAIVTRGGSVVVPAGV